jgi:hypothetical protein
VASCIVPPVMFTEDVLVMSPCTTSVPAETRVSPVQLFVPVSVSVPSPALATPIGAPAMVEETVAVAPATMSKRPTASVPPVKLTLPPVTFTRADRVPVTLTV